MHQRTEEIWVSLVIRILTILKIENLTWPAIRPDLNCYRIHEKGAICMIFLRLIPQSSEVFNAWAIRVVRISNKNNYSITAERWEIIKPCPISTRRPTRDTSFYAMSLSWRRTSIVTIRPIQTLSLRTVNSRLMYSVVARNRASVWCRRKVTVANTKRSWTVTTRRTPK